jgi:hypothetical protein
MIRIITRKIPAQKIFPLLLLAVVLASCASPSPEKIEIGIAQSDVVRLLGQPDRTQEFDYPDEPFFGPQESLTGLVEPGETVIEWIYELGDNNLYIWFTGGPGWPRSSLRVIAFATYPKDAVF